VAKLKRELVKQLICVGSALTLWVAGLYALTWTHRGPFRSPAPGRIQRTFSLTTRRPARRLLAAISKHQALACTVANEEEELVEKTVAKPTCSMLERLVQPMLPPVRALLTSITSSAPTPLRC
jgi:hypothetical protein